MPNPSNVGRTILPFQATAVKSQEDMDMTSEEKLWTFFYDQFGEHFIGSGIAGQIWSNGFFFDRIYKTEFENQSDAMLRFHRINLAQMQGKARLQDFLVQFGIEKATDGLHHGSWMCDLKRLHMFCNLDARFAAIHSFFIAFLMIWLIYEIDLLLPLVAPKSARQMQSPSSLPLTEAIKHCATRMFWSSFCQRHRRIGWCQVSSHGAWKALDSNDLSPCESCIQMQVSYDLEDQKSLAKYLEDSNIRLIRAECPALHSWRYFSNNYGACRLTLAHVKYTFGSMLQLTQSSKPLGIQKHFFLQISDSQWFNRLHVSLLQVSLSAVHLEGWATTTSGGWEREGE